MATFATAVKMVHQNRVKGRKVALCTVTGSAAIGAEDTGYIVTAVSLGFAGIDGCIKGYSRDGVYSVTGTPVVGTTPTIPGTSLRLQYYNAATATEAGVNEAGVDGTVTDILIVGY